jgi:hypothetical protein
MTKFAIRFTTVLALLLPTLAHAQSWDAKALKRRDAPASATSKNPASGMKPCPEYGAGFYRIDGTGTCIRISGGVAVDVGASGTRR